MRRHCIVALFVLAVCAAQAWAHEGYYRYPALHEDVLIFNAEGDLWIVSDDGGTARRLTTHHGEETQPAISPDGTLVAFMGQYEGATEVYVIPVAGGTPRRMTYGSVRASLAGWTPDGKIMFASRHRAGLPNTQLFTLDVETGAEAVYPLEQASDGCVAEDGTLVFTRLPFQGSRTKRYVGGTARQLWTFDASMEEAVELLPADRVESWRPMAWRDRIYFVSDRNGTANLWSMTMDGGDLKQHTQYVGWDMQSASMHDGRVVFQQGADLFIHDVRRGRTDKVDIDLASDLDQMREKRVMNPMRYVSDASPSADGEKVVITARGELFIATRKKGRLIHLERQSDVRYRQARFMPDGDRVFALSDETGEVELWTLPARNGAGEREQHTEDGRGVAFRSGAVAGRAVCCVQGQRLRAVGVRL